MMNKSNLTGLTKMERFHSDVIENVVNDYESGMNYKTIHVKYGLSMSTRSLHSFLRKVGARTRFDQNNSCVQEFLLNDTLEKYWVLGCLMSDGCIVRDRNGSHHLRFNSKDHDFVDNFTKALGVRFPTWFNVQDGRGIDVMVNNNNKELLFNYNIVPNKSLIAEFPLNIPDVFFPDYIRGLYDGDGTFRAYYPTIAWGEPWKKKWGKQLMSIYYSGSHTFLDGLKSMLRSKIGIKGRMTINRPSGSSTWRITLATNDTKRLCNFIYYSGFEESLCLLRKYKRVSEFINK